MSKKILLADDSITIQKVVELTFSDGDYEVIATNNGTKAMEEIPRVRPDIILSDIIMPEKNGYELCEWVKSHPEHRHIPVILLTGTFEPFDPDRAEKAGCDAVVTKPFESQSLIQKVEELISKAATTSQEPAGPADEPSDVFAPERDSAFDENPSPQQNEQMVAESPSETSSSFPPPAPAFEMDEPRSAEPSPFDGEEEASVAEPQSTPFPVEEEEPKPHGDVFAEEAPARNIEDDDTATRMIPKMSMEDIERIRAEQQQQSEESMRSEIPPMPESEEFAPSSPQSTYEEDEASPFDAPADSGSEEMEEDSTRIIPKMSMEEIQRLQQQSMSAPETDVSPFSEAPPSEEADSESAPFGSEDSAEPAGEPAAQSMDEPPAFEPVGQTEDEDFDDSSTRMIPKIAFEDVQRMQQENEQFSEPEQTGQEPPEMAEAPAFGMGAPGPSDEEGAANPFASEAPSETAGAFPTEDQKWPEEETEAQEQPEPDERLEAEREPSAPFTEPEAEILPPPPHPPEEPIAREPEPEATAGAVPSGETSAATALSDEQVERIARRVVELLSDKAIREIAWEVIPETAEMVVRERIRQLEGDEG